MHRRTAYIASKGSINALTLSMAVDLGPQGIHVNTIVIGYMHSDRWVGLPAAHVQQLRTNVPPGREATSYFRSGAKTADI